jgi:GWxTD domain-containing protein
MSVPNAVIAIAALSLSAQAALAADKLDKADKKWLEEEVAAIILPNEEKVFKNLKKEDRAEFQKIFWARRDPDPESAKPENDFKAEHVRRRTEADRQFRGVGRPGALTDCGRVLQLFGEPDQKRSEPRAEAGAAVGMRQPETWVYKEKPSIPFKLRDGELALAFDETCMFPEGSRMTEQLQRVAEARVTRPGLEFRIGKDGRLVKLADLLPKPSPALTLLKEPRQDFPVAADAQFLKVQDGGTALVGVVHGKAEGLTVQKLTVVAGALDAEGKLSQSYEQLVNAPVDASGEFAASYRLALKPGKYTVRAGAYDDATKKGSLSTSEVEVPDLNTGEISAASLILVKEIEENASTDPAHPYSAYLIGNARLVPRSGRTFTKADSVMIFWQYYDAKPDPATGKPSVVVTLGIVDKSGKPVAKAADQPTDQPVAGNVIGPVPLDKYEPGPYTIRFKAIDNVAKKEVARELQFEIR